MREPALDTIDWKDKLPHGAIVLDDDNFEAATKGLPSKARLTLSVATKLPYGSLAVTVPDGRIFAAGGNAPGPHAEIKLNNWNLPSRAFSASSIGVAESYMDGDWESPDVTQFLLLFVVNVEAGEALAGGSNALLTALQRFRHWLNRNTRIRAKRNISAHYDLGNDFYEKWLDPSMTYSSALFSTGANDLQSAQMAKYRALAKDTGIGPDDHGTQARHGFRQQPTAASDIEQAQPAERGGHG